MRVIVPQTRLLRWVALVCLPFAALAALVPAAVAVSSGLIIGLAVLAAADALMSRGCLKAVHVAIPESLRMSVGRSETLRVHVDLEGSAKGEVHIGVSLPAEIVCKNVVRKVDFPPPSGGALLEWSLQATAKGRYRIRDWHLQMPSRLGFWGMRQRRSSPVEVCVYPNLVQEKSRLAALFTRRHLGLQVQRQVGKGREFDQLREYQPGDSYEDIHWKATAKRNMPITKVYQIERTQRIYTILDASRLSARLLAPGAGAFPEGFMDEGFGTMMDRYVTAALIMALAAQRQGDHFGLVTFSDRVQTFIPAKSGLAHYNVCRDALFTLEARRVSPDFAELFAFIGTRLRRRALLVFLTHMDDPVLAQAFARHIGLLARRHVVMVNMLKPPAATPIFSSDTVSETADIYRHLGGHLLWRQLEETRQVLRRHGAGFAQLNHAEVCTEVVAQYLALKQRQAI